MDSKPRASFEFEVEKVVGISADGRYQVQWAPAWVSKLHLVGCEHLIQEFLQEQNELDGDLENQDHTTSMPNDTSHSRDTREWQELVNATEIKIEAVFDDDDHYGDAEAATDEILDPTPLIKTESSDASQSYQTDGISMHNMDGNEGISTVDSTIKTTTTGKALSTQVYLRDSKASSVCGIDIMESSAQPQVLLVDSLNAHASTDRITEHFQEPFRGQGSHELSCQSDKKVNRGLYYFNSNSEKKYALSHHSKTSTHTGGTSQQDRDSSASNQHNLKTDGQNQYGCNSSEFSCPVCHKMFESQHHLEGHMRSHTGQKPFACEQCDRSFIDQSSLKRHARLHSSDKQFTCHICQKSFTQKSTLVRHILIHTGTKPYACDVCDMRFTQLVTKTKHMKRKHSAPFD